LPHTFFAENNLIFAEIKEALKLMLKYGYIQTFGQTSVCSILEHTAGDGKKYQTKYYNLDAILSVGYRVNSINATLFRQWATHTLKDYLLKGYAINQKIERVEKQVETFSLETDRRLTETEKKIDFFVKTPLF
jgi:hypothetical protein